MTVARSTASQPSLAGATVGHACRSLVANIAGAGKRGVNGRHHLRGALLVPILIALLCGFQSGCSTLSRDDPGARTVGTIMDDQVLESTAKRNIKRAHEDLRRSHIGVTSFNGVVLITGQVPTPELKELASREVSTMRNVRRIHNEIQVAGPTTLLARSNDSWLTAKVKSRLVANDQVNGDRIKVVSENGVVFLMGLVRRAEGKVAAEVARTVYGVEQVVTVFEYVDGTAESA